MKALRFVVAVLTSAALSAQWHLFCWYWEHSNDSNIIEGNRFGNPGRKWAYAFMLSGCDPDRPNESYRGMLYHVLVSARILRLSNTMADIVVMVQFESRGSKNMDKKDQSLPIEDCRLLRLLDVRIIYLPPWKGEIVPNIDRAVSKFWILNLVEYSRVLFLDVMPLCSLDYLFELSDPLVTMTKKNENGNQPTLPLKENIIFAWHMVPAWDAIFMLTPKRGDYDRLYEIFRSQRQRHSNYFDAFEGWGASLLPTREGYMAHQPDSSMDSYETDANAPELPPPIRVFDKDKPTGYFWSWLGADSSSGLIYHWTKYEQQTVSIVVKDEVEQWKDGKLESILTDEPLWSYSCLPDSASQRHHYGFNHPRTRHHVPYRDFRAFDNEVAFQYFANQEEGIAEGEGNDVVVHKFKNGFPWESSEPPNRVTSRESVESSWDYWFFQLRMIKEEFNMTIDSDFFWDL